MCAFQVKAVVQQILDEGRRGARRVKNTPLMWAWHSKYYLGGALLIATFCVLNTSIINMAPVRL